MHFPRRREKHLDVFRRKEIRRAVRSVENANLPLASIPGSRTLGKFVQLCWWRRFTEVQHITGAQHASLPAEFSQDESGAAAEKCRSVDAASDGEVGTCARILCVSNFEQGILFYGCRLPSRDGAAVKPRPEIRAREGDCGITSKAQSGSCERDLKTRRIFPIAHQAVGKPKSQRIHRT